ncbi:MAG TPA: Coenzyme F420 hydrogenase/dehydrogenase, beta subunit C-terminal domain [Candidatus Marinimicrobia bacterium]|jgi:coenzyme F420 hydrogenase subunit beta|nr:hypothetical protein [Candidatus Neomarinimicrobiota bacterium]MDP6142776.1 Coenzyme F420 hydrogenase/dehydrogenase, beta subunit C-terminal domain [Candidatus Neomarinimicrobiota bacterium]MDP6260967.1 Coenzyme F420 hydrogenase/dehydrogenase, beta subunit C-terminal domain [Candidatus Neomarinimicrobiota bacterium]MDP7126840.1 Coenzyme F420 hydrogenase/dehydrogenase, beta subunit C-terminal domain [Candidatus Neomarinimicrobiota bacterium]MDP7337524.1 Coenzyme F420 hydrogenase/dehydrogenase|tara:strand:+ start:1905 stop:3245 length:1341 start_codon:yes stop_codon:yes gene_type:complete
MLTQYRTVEKVVNDNLCMGCGVCSSICPENAIQIGMDQKRGYFVPSIDNDACNYCGQMKNGKCVIVCPGVEVDFQKLGNRWVNGNAEADILGSFVKTVYAHSKDENIRYRSSSGGLIPTLLIFALTENIIDGAIVVKSDEDNPLIPRGILATTSEEIKAASGSKYCSAHIGEPLSEILKTDGKYAVVGLPCHIHGIRKWEQMTPGIAEKIVLHLGLYCANNNTIFATEYFLWQKYIDPEQVKNIRYRGKGWPGNIIVTLKDGTMKEIKRGTTETSWQRKLLFSSAFHYDFQIPRCLTCVDLTAELADISFADPWNKRFLLKESKGKSMLVIRNEIGMQLVDKAILNGIIASEEADSSEVRLSQNIEFKKRAPSRVWIRQILGLPAPVYKGKSYKKRVWDIFSYGNYYMSYVTVFPVARLFLPIVRICRWIINSSNRIMKKYFRQGK